MQDQRHQSAHIIRTQLDVAVRARMHRHRETRAVGQRLHHVLHHIQGICLGRALGHGVQNGNFSQPEPAILENPALHSHVVVSSARRTMARAKRSLISA